MSSATSSNMVSSWSPFQIQTISLGLIRGELRASEAALHKELQKGSSYYKDLLDLNPDLTITTNLPLDGILASEQDPAESPSTASALTSPTSPPALSDDGSADADNKFDTLYKTEMCGSFSVTGICPYKNKCKFAHGPQELRVVKRHPKYKSTRCRNFSETGVCPYGDRCCFLHKRD